MEQNLDEIAELAESLGSHNLVNGKVNLARIAKRKGIELIYGHYEDHFLGQLVHSSRRFYIHLNQDKLTDKNSARSRFTIAHELGHYFIDSHRTQLSNGITLSYKNDLSNKTNEKIERQANHFASHLMMPKKHFIRLAKKFEPGLESILKLRSKFDTSIECTTLHYINLDIANCIMIKWRPDFSFYYSSYSKSFSQFSGIKEKAPVKFNSDYIREQVKLIEADRLDYIEDATSLSKWISTIVPGSKKDYIGLQQTIKLGEFGGITLLVFLQ